MPYNIAFDIAHKPRGKIDENLTELRDFLNNNDFICYNFLETPITQNSLKPFDILIFVCPDFAKITSMEISEIINWVREDGGGLLLLSHAGGDKGRNSNLSELSQRFGIVFENDQVLDETYNLGMENLPIITSFIPPHPITNGIASICYRSGCSLTVLGNAFSVASSNETSEPFSSPLICVTEPDNGRVCAIGSYEMFRDKVGGGFNCDEHPNLAFNIFNWLISDYRMELRSNGAIPVITPYEEVNLNQTAEYHSSSFDSGFVEKRNFDIDYTMKISKKSELIDLLKIFQQQIDNIKTTIDKLIRITLASEDESSELKNSKTYQQYETPIGTPQLNESNLKPPKTYKAPPVQDFLDLQASIEPSLTELPPKPESLADKYDENFIGLPLVDENVKLKPVPKPKKKKRKKKDLIAEREGLEGKVNSVRNLLDFIEKKHKAGQIDKKDYEKRIDQLKKDLKKTQDRIEEINKLL